MQATKWKTVGASVAGFSHQASGAACQDYYATLTPADGWLLAAVSDGAGSAPRALEGAKAICEGVVSHVAHRMSSLSSTNDVIDLPTGRLWIVEGIEDVRAKLTETVPDDSLTVFNATLVGVIAGPKGGLFFHIGDGAGCATNSEDYSFNVLSLPENGEYANETYFFTHADWQEHLRLTHFGEPFDVVTVMSDGVTPFALAPGAGGLHGPFFEPLSNYLMTHSEEEGQHALAATLERDAIRRITSDDKTLLWALRTKSNGSIPY